MSNRYFRAFARPAWTSTMLRCVALALATVYLAWNLLWLSQSTVPPSLFTAISGLPCPTTGGTRALSCLVAGDVHESLRFNAMAVPFVLMFVATLLTLAFRGRSRRSLSLPSWVVPTWLVLLLVAWILKLSSSPSYW